MSRLRQSQLGLAFCLLSLTALPALSQNWGVNKNQPVETGGESRLSEPKALKEQPDLPQLPAYSGKSKFQNGTVQSNAEGWTVYTMNILAEEKPEEVRNWYQNAFNMYQWKIPSSAPLTLSAEQKNGNSCYIMVNPIREPVYKSRVKMTYMVAPDHFNQGQ